MHLILLLACAPHPASTAPAHPTALAPAAAAAPDLHRGPALGGAGLGFVEASTADGRYVLVRRWEAGVQPNFGHHGEAWPEPSLVLLDYSAGTEREVDELMDISAERRYLVVRSVREVQLLGGPEPRELKNIDLRSDDNACLEPRGASFSVEGQRLATIMEDGQGVRVEDLGSGQSWTIATTQRIWRAWPDALDRAAWLMELPADSAGWPRQNTSCACLWCNRFALSYGFYGWAGPAFSIAYVDSSGLRSERELPRAPGRAHGPTDSGCELRPASEGEQLDQGPWQWSCP